MNLLHMKKERPDKIAEAVWRSCVAQISADMEGSKDSTGCRLS